MSKDYVMQLEATIANLKRDKVLLKEMKNEQDKVLEVIKEKPIRSGIAIKQIKKQIDYSQYKKIILELSEAYLLTEEEFDLLKRCFK